MVIDDTPGVGHEEGSAKLHGVARASAFSIARSECLQGLDRRAQPVHAGRRNPAAR